MRNTTLFAGIIALFSFGPKGFGDLAHNTDPEVTFATQYGNRVTCHTQVKMPGFVGLTTKYVVGFYLSPDTTISTSDQLIGTFTVNPVGIYSVNCVLSDIDLAALSTPNGTYYIGSYIDIHNSVAEKGTNPEIENNSWAFRNSGGDLKVINFPGLDVSLEETTFKNQIVQMRDADGSYIVRSASGRNIHAELRSIEGKLISGTSGVEILIQRQHPGIYILRTEDGTGASESKKVYW